jgi:MoaA/NifB/PqqE/SkfB family radical SAM enzyme
MQDKKRFKMVSIYSDSLCNMRCKDCYLRNRIIPNKKSQRWFIELPKYLKELTDQVAIACSEPLMLPGFIISFAKACADNNIICNITTNGRLFPRFRDSYLRRLLKNVGMVSISYDEWKIRNPRDDKHYEQNVKRLVKLGYRVGCNLLLSQKYLGNLDFYVKKMFDMGCERVFLLHPKPRSLLPVSDIKVHLDHIRSLMTKYEHLYVDDYLIMVDRYGYDDWGDYCHGGGNFFSIRPDGGVSICSFAEPEMWLDKPKDLLKLKKHNFKRRKKCVM